MAMIAAAVLGVMMILTTVDVVGRYFFGLPITGSWEIIGLLLIFGGTWGMAYCQKDKAHINVTVILDLLPARIQEIVLSIAYLVGMAAFSIIAWRTLLLTQKYFLMKGHVTDILRIPLYPFTLAIALMAAMTLIVLSIDLIHSLYKIFRK